jgi:signal transduction histidine kinase
VKLFALRWIAPALLTLIFVILILSSGQQLLRARTEFEKTLETALIYEGGERIRWLSDRLDPFYNNWYTSSAESNFPNLTKASWLLLDASGEVFLDNNGNAFYANPVSASGEIEWKQDQETFDLAAHGEIVSGPLRMSQGLYRMRVFLPVTTASGSISAHWVLVGEAAGEATQEEGSETLFDQLFNAQRQFWFTATPLAFAALLLLVLLYRGITRTSRLEASLRDAEESIEIESLTSTLAHELRNPLSIIQSCAEILRKQENLTEDGNELTADILEEITRSQEVLLRHLHPERYLITEIENLGSFCADFWQHRQALLRTHSVQLEMKTPDAANPLGVHAVGDQLEKILDNLLRNSIEAMPRGGSIRFSLENQGDRVWIRFEDSGPGFGSNPFFTRDGWRFGPTKPAGKGIGLRLARKWVERWGGELTAKTLRTGLFGKVKGTEILIQLCRLGEPKISPNSHPLE